MRRVQVLAGLLVLASGSGLLLDVHGDETAFTRNVYRGADLVSALLSVPLLLLALRSARRGSVRGVLLLLGGLGYAAYQYGYPFAYGWSRDAWSRSGQCDPRRGPSQSARAIGGSPVPVDVRGQRRHRRDRPRLLPGVR